jgi:anti-sigma B factor antagonist
MLQDCEHQQQRTKILVLEGQFNRATTTGIQGRILEAVEMGCHHIILDFSGVTEIDSTGLGELFLWYHNTRPHHVHISIMKPQPHIEIRLDWSHISEVIPIYTPEEEAMKQPSVVS